MSLITKDGLVKIGIPWGFNEWTDVDNYYTEYIYSHINIVDFIPVIPKFNEKSIESIRNDKKLSQILKNLYIPDVEEGCQYYNSLLKKFKLSEGCEHIKGVRLYITDNTQLAETITNNYRENIMQNAFQKFNDNVKQVGETLRTIKGATYKPPAFITQLLEDSSKRDIIGTVESFLSGMRIDFPVIWNNTEYIRRTSLNIVLTTPYGHPEAVWVWIVRPLLYLILLGSPVNWYGAVGYPLYISVRSHGLFHIPLAAIETITIDRGGPNTSFNIYKQPLKVVVNITIRDLYSTLSVDPEINIDAKNIVTTPTPQTSEIEIHGNSMPTIDKLVKSFAPEKRNLSTYKTKMSYIKSSPQFNIALNNPIEEAIKTSQNIGNNITTTTNTTIAANDADEKLKKLLSDFA